MQKLDEAKAKLQKFNELQLVVKIGIVFGALGISLISLIYPIAMIAIGAQHKDECTINFKIPIWLIVYGSVSLVSVVIGFVQFALTVFVKNAKLVIAFINLLGCNITILGLFSFAWFITGNVWVYSVHASVNTSDSSSGNYCQYTLYWFAFWTITVVYILLGVVLILGCLALAVVPAVVIFIRSKK